MAPASGTMATDTTAMAPASGTATTGTAAGTQVASAEEMANRIVLDVTREQLQQAPAYEGNARQVAQ